MTRRLLEQELEEIHPACFGWALACCGWDREEAHDVLQTAYLKVLEGRATFDRRSTFRTWLFAVIRLTEAERRRRLWRLGLGLARWIRLRAGPPAVPAPESLAGASEAGARLRAALQLLPRRQRETLHLVFSEDLTLVEAAAVLGISLGSARTHYHRGKARLRRAFPVRPA
jgi:RNA polymerase sigma-70 factor (ECF subfamily)